jgi:hypothetical protein
MGWMSRIRVLWNRDKHSSDLDEELEFHLLMRENWNAEQGMGSEAARINADSVKRFVGVTHQRIRMSQGHHQGPAHEGSEPIWTKLGKAKRMEVTL